jgi:hypothetical protein
MKIEEGSTAEFLLNLLLGGFLMFAVLVFCG